MKSVLTYLRRRWKRILAANGVSFALQALAFALLTVAGIDVALATVAAKGSSWLAFVLQLTWPALRRALA